jgi:hypothetical protein
MIVNHNAVKSFFVKYLFILYFVKYHKMYFFNLFNILNNDQNIFLKAVKKIVRFVF